LGRENFPDFLLVYLSSRHIFVRQFELFRIIRSNVSSREEVVELLQGMEEDMNAYLSLTQVESSQWPVDLQEHV